MSWVAALLQRAASAPRWTISRWAAPRQAASQAALETARLRLIAVTAPMLEAELGTPASLEGLTGARLTAEWPPEHWEPALLQLLLQHMRDEPADAAWHRYIVLADANTWARTLIGAIGAFPREAGDVEIAYSMLPAFQRRGYATEAVKAFVDDLLTREGVASVSAQSLVDTPESIKVMQRCGMAAAGSGDDPGTVRYRRLRGFTSLSEG